MYKLDSNGAFICDCLVDAALNSAVELILKESDQDWIEIHDEAARSMIDSLRASLLRNSMDDDLMQSCDSQEFALEGTKSHSRPKPMPIWPWLADLPTVGPIREKNKQLEVN
jgi:hypothetical protein